MNEQECDLIIVKKNIHQNQNPLICRGAVEIIKTISIKNVLTERPYLNITHCSLLMLVFQYFKGTLDNALTFLFG